jgi:hypothetical protein
VSKPKLIKSCRAEEEEEVISQNTVIYVYISFAVTNPNLGYTQCLQDGSYRQLVY